MINIQKELNKAKETKNTCKQEFLLKLKSTFNQAKDKPPSLLSQESELLAFIIQNAKDVTSQELDSLILSLGRNEKASCCRELLQAS